MPTCGYVCPSCEGKEYDEHGNKCEWCSIEEKKTYADRRGIIDKIKSDDGVDKKDDKKDLS